MSGANQWTPLGPDCIIDGQMDEGGGRAPVSGRVTAIVLDGATLFVGTAGGGVWRSDDEGVNWAPLDDKQACLAVGAMVLDAATKRLYIATGEGNSGGRMQFGQGLLIYDTQAKTFLPRVSEIPAGTGPFFRKIRTSAMVIEPAFGGGAKTLWMGTNAGVFRSTDNGQTWHQSTLLTATTQAVSDLCVTQGVGGQRLLVGGWAGYTTSTNEKKEVIVTAQTSGVFVKRPDLDFDLLPKDTPPSDKLPKEGVGRIGLAVAPSNTARVYCVMALNKGAGFHGLYMSDTAGQNWTRRTLPEDGGKALKQSSYNLAIAVDPNSPNTLIFGEKALWRSTDGGMSWTCISAPSGDSPGTHSDQHVVVYDPAHPNRVWLGNDGGVWLSNDGGSTWASRNRGLNTLQYYALVHHAGADTVLLAGAQDNGTQRFAGNPGWNLVGYGDGFFCGIDSSDPRYWYSSYVYRSSSGDLTGIKRSSEAGAISSWRAITDGIDNAEYIDQANEPFYVPFVLDPVTPSTLYLGTTHLWRSTDRGDTWQALSQDDGTRFSTFTETDKVKKPSADDGISAICVDPNDTKVIYVGTRRGDVFQIIITSVDGQGTPTCIWSVRGQPPAVPGGLPAVANAPDVVNKDYCADLAVPKLAAPGPMASRPVYVAYGSDYLTSTLPQSVHNGRVWKVDFTNRMLPAWTALGSAQLDGATHEPPNIPFGVNFANALAIDPNNPQRIFVGCHSGVFESTNGGGAWTAFSTGLPNAPVVDLQFHPTRRLLRAATMGRSVWERPVDTIAPPDVSTADVFIRDNIVDLGRYSTHATAPDPLNPPGQVSWLDGVDIKVDAKSLLGNFDKPISTQDYSGSGAIDYISFQQLEHEDFIRGRQAHVFVQLTNRGPQKATGVTVRLYWARMSGDTIPALPADFWGSFPDGNLGAAGAWQAMGAKQTVGELPAGSPRIAQFDFSPPDESVDLAVMAVMTSVEDPLNGSGTDVATIAQNNKHVVVRRVPVSVSTAEIVLTILAVVGVVAGTAAVMAATA